MITDTTKNTITIETDVEHFIVVAAFRYALGRKPYAVSIVVDFLIKNWSKIPKSDRALIMREILEALDKHDAGMKMDETEWMRVLKLEGE